MRAMLKMDNMPKHGFRVTFVPKIDSGNNLRNEIGTMVTEEVSDPVEEQDLQNLTNREL